MTVYYVLDPFASHYTETLGRRTEEERESQNGGRQAFLLISNSPFRSLGNNSIREGVKVHEACVYTFSQPFSFMAFIPIVIVSFV